MPGSLRPRDRLPDVSGLGERKLFHPSPENTDGKNGTSGRKAEKKLGFFPDENSKQSYLRSVEEKPLQDG